MATQTTIAVEPDTRNIIRERADDIGISQSEFVGRLIVWYMKMPREVADAIVKRVSPRDEAWYLAKVAKRAMAEAATVRSRPPEQAGPASIGSSDQPTPEIQQPLPPRRAGNHKGQAAAK